MSVTAVLPSKQLGPWTITAEQEFIEVDPGPQPDERWRFIDAAGHGHFWDQGYPTLNPEEFNCYCSAIEEEHTDTRLVCPHCGEIVRPATTEGLLLRRMEPGRLHVSLAFDDGRNRREYDGFTDEDGRAILNDPIEAIPRLTADRVPSVFEFRR